MPKPDRPVRLSAKQISLIHLAAKQLGFDDAIYRTILKVQGGVDSARDLDNLGFDRVMAYFTAHGFRSTWTKRTFGKRPGMASPRQVELIRKLWAQRCQTARNVAPDRRPILTP